MSQSRKSGDVMPLATPTEADLAAWAARSPDEQVCRYQEQLQHPDCNTFTTDTYEDILAAARRRVSVRRNS
jgi:hypothetical protein